MLLIIGVNLEQYSMRSDCKSARTEKPNGTAQTEDKNYNNYNNFCPAYNISKR